MRRPRLLAIATIFCIFSFFVKATTKDLSVRHDLLQEFSIGKDRLVHFGQLLFVAQVTQELLICSGECVYVFPSTVIRRDLDAYPEYSNWFSNAKGQEAGLYAERETYSIVSILLKCEHNLLESAFFLFDLCLSERHGGGRIERVRFPSVNIIDALGIALSEAHVLDSTHLIADSTVEASCEPISSFSQSSIRLQDENEMPNVLCKRMTEVPRDQCTHAYC